ncbi:MAG: NAD(P)H-dependent oxidoreductase [Burkholderiales bacterium]|jgi:nitroreductase|nr:NAD(P)H-dependent oxidoreductase [Burkholderiales bacterium]
MSDFMKAMNFRHACKLFDEKKKIPVPVFDEILEAGRLSPSSFGTEPWHFLVITSNEVKAALRPACWNQPQITTCSHFVMLLVRKPQDFEFGSAFLNETFTRRANTPDKLSAICGAFDNFIRSDLKPDVLNWAKMQTYIAGGNMMTAAAFLGVDTCAIEGFNFNALTDALARAVPSVDLTRYEIAWNIAFGYRVNEQQPRYRFPREKVTTFI